MLRQLLHLDPSLGASGDMLLASLVKLGAEIHEIEAELENIKLDSDFTIQTSTQLRNGIEGFCVDIRAENNETLLTWSEIDSLIENSDLSGGTRAGARNTFTNLAEALAAVQQVSIEKVDLAEAGTFESIITILSAWIAVDLLKVDLVSSSSIGLGYGVIQTEGGQVPLPTPTTLKLLEGLPVKYLEIEGETVTQSGAALLATMVDTWDVAAEGYVVRSSRGAGSRNPGTHANVLTATLLKKHDLENSVTSQTLVKLDTNLDDTTAEVVSYCIDKALAAGALDAWTTPVTMKLGRPGVTLTVLCEPPLVDEIKELMFRQTKTLGIRESLTTRTSAWRRVEIISYEGHDVRIKVGPYGAKPEFEDLVTLANELDVPVRRIANEVTDLYQSQFRGD